MGKKMKRKGPNPRKALHRVPAGSPKSVLEPRGGKGDAVDDGEKGGESRPCNHYSRSSEELNRILLKILSNSNDLVACEHCREEPSYRRGGREKGKQPKKKGGGGGAKTSGASSESNFFWVCLDCNRYFCGGGVDALEPFGHSRRHSKQDHHPWAVRLDNPLISWCYLCSSAVPIKMPDEVKSEPASATDSVEQGKGGDGVESLGLESMKGYSVRGLANLGNTCFFNSVMQNLLAIDMLREYLVALDQPFGPITMTLKKLFVETSLVVDGKGVISPKALFGSICVKAPQFRGYQQQDSHELLRYLLDGLHVEELSSGKSQDSSGGKDKADSKSGGTFVDAFFGGQLSSTVSCVECGHTSVVHEPFLDLSLPLPSKKPPPKKAPPPPPKRTKPPLKERNKGRRFRERGTARESPVTNDHQPQSSDHPSECSEACAPAQEQYQNASLEVDYSLAWMDILDGPSIMPDDGELDSKRCEVCVAQPSDTEQISQSVNNDALCTVNSQPADCSKDPVVSLDSCVESSCRNEVPSSCIQDSVAPLFPPKELYSAVVDVNSKASCSQNMENAASLDAPLNESSVAELGQAEVDFDGFGDLFNEPEVTSALKTENGEGEEMDIMLWTGISSESNPDEVDNTNSPVSIISCLVLFTKPEILCDEQAWHCERCSEHVQCHNVEQRRDEGKQRTVEKPGDSETVKPQMDGVELVSEVPSSKFEVDSIELKVAGIGETTLSPLNAYEKPPDLIRGSDSNGQIRNEGSLNILDPTLSDQACCSDLPVKDVRVMVSGNTSVYLSCPSALESTHSQEISGNQESDFCSFNDLNSVGCENDSIDEVNHSGEKVVQLLKKQNSVASNGNEKIERVSRKVLRDATKRILIGRAPLILTIHLKRFSQDARGRLSKLRGHVSFQETLDLRPYMDPRSGERDKCCYRLVGVVEHSGGMHGGHYVAYVRGERGKGKTQRCGSPAWFFASDGHVREVSLSEVLQSEAYILFYERC